MWSKTAKHYHTEWLGRKQQTTLKCQHSAVKYFFPLSTQCFLECQHAGNTTQQLAICQPSLGWGTGSSEPARTELTPVSLSEGHRLTGDRRTRPEVAGKLYGSITVERYDRQPMPKSNIPLTVREVREECCHVDTQHCTDAEHLRWNHYLLASSHCPELDTDWLAQVLQFLQASLCLLMTHLSGNWHRYQF